MYTLDQPSLNQPAVQRIAGHSMLVEGMLRELQNVCNSKAEPVVGEIFPDSGQYYNRILHGMQYIAFSDLRLLLQTFCSLQY